MMRREESISIIKHDLTSVFAHWMLHSLMPFQVAVNKLKELGLSDEDATDFAFEALITVIEEAQ